MTTEPFQTKPAKWYLTVWAVVIWLSILGPFALPFVWKSPAFSRFWKWILSISVIVLTAFLTWSTWYAIDLAWKTIAAVSSIT